MNIKFHSTVFYGDKIEECEQDEIIFSKSSDNTIQSLTEGIVILK